MQGMTILSCWVMGALQGAILILIPEMMSQGQLSALQLALPLSLGTFVFMYCSGRWGTLLDKQFIAHQSLIVIIRWVLLGFFFSQLSFVLLLQFSDLQGISIVLALCISRVLHGVFCSAIIPSAQLILSRDDKKGEKLIWSSIATNVGRLSAPLLTFVPLNIAYFSLWFIAAITLSALFLAWINQGISASKVIIAEDKKNSEVNSNATHIKASRVLFSLFSNPLLLYVCLTALLISLFSAQLQFSLGPLLFAQFSNVKLASEMTATLLFTASGSALFSLFILYRPLSRFPKVFLFIITSSLITGTYLFVIQQYLLLSIALISSALSMAAPWYTALVMHASQYNKARSSASVSQGHTLGNAFGGIMGGLFLGLGTEVLLVSFIVLVVFILLAWLAIYYQDCLIKNTLIS
ncbi:MAG: permease [Psychromonas sp.]